jgi:ATP-binding cassette subfamily B protein
MLLEDPPAEVLSSLEEQDGIEGPILFQTPTDIDLSGQPGREWLLITPGHVAVVAEGSATVLRSVAIVEVHSFRALAGVGSGTLQARVGDAWIDLVRYSNRLADTFFKTASKLEILRQEGTFDLDPADRHDPRRCAACGLRLSSPGESCPRCLPKGAILSRVLELVRPEAKGVLLLTVLTFFGVVAELVPPKLQQYMVDHLLTNGRGQSEVGGILTALVVVVLALAGSRLVLAVVGAIKGRIGTRIGAALTARLRSQLVERLQKLSIAYFDRHHAGSLMSRVVYDSEVLHGLVLQLTGGFLLQILQLVGVGIMLVYMNPKLAMYTLIPVPLVVGGTWYFWQRVYPRYYRYWDANSKQVQAVSSMLGGIRVVKSFAQEEREQARFEGASSYLRSMRLWVEESTANYSAVMQLVFSLGGLIVWYVGGRDVIASHMTLGELIAFLAYLAMFYAPLGALSQFTTWLTSFLTGAKRVMELLDTPIAVEDPSQPVQAGPARGEIRFENVTFGYDRHSPVIKGISFDIKPGEMIGVVGRSGSGKTTLVNLLCRFYDADEGSVKIDGIDVRDYSLADLRRRVGIVLQESYLFRGTIWDNLCYGRPDTEIKLGLAAAKAASAHDFILRSPLGYETMLGEHGAGLSGGEKQRLSLARAILYNPPILILDEATSSVDTEAERAIQEALERLTRGRTVIAIAHRLSTLRNSDRIMVFERGKLIEQGPHRELLEKNGTYAKLVRIQTQLTKDANVDQLTHQSVEPLAPATPAPATEPSASQPSVSGPAAHEVNWLSPEDVSFAMSSSGVIELRRPDGSVQSGLMVSSAFPATFPEKYLSVRTWDEGGDEKEVGMIEDLADWSVADQQVLRAAKCRRYLLRSIQSIESLHLEHGHLWFEVTTDRGPESFAMRWSPGHAVDFGKNGKLIIDVEDNRFVIENVENLPREQFDLLRRHIYW